MICVSKTILSRKNDGQTVIVLSLFDMQNGRFAYEKRTLNLKKKVNVFQFNPFNSRYQAEGLIRNELIDLREHHWIDIESKEYDGSYKVVKIGANTFVLDGADLPTVICSGERLDFDKGVEYLLHQITDDNYFLVENRYGEVVHCQPEDFDMVVFPETGI